MNAPFSLPPLQDINWAEVYSARAIWMVDLCNRMDNGPYAGILDEIRRSDPCAGGPMQRLANAIWWGRYRRLFPQRRKLRLAEEHAYSRLVMAHRDIDKSRMYFVWRGMEKYVPIRERLFGREATAELKKTDLGLLDWRLPEALCKLDSAALLTGKEDLARILAICVTLDPNESIIPVVEALAQTVWAHEVWLRGDKTANWEATYKQADRKLASLRKARQRWLAGTRLQEACALLDASFHPPAR
jgi:hypothetical protein